jgi:hypothetical protein
MVGIVESDDRGHGNMCVRSHIVADARWTAKLMALDCKCNGLKGIQVGLKPKCLCDLVAKQLHFNCKIDGPHGKFAVLSGPAWHLATDFKNSYYGCAIGSENPEKLSIAPHACISHKPTFISSAGMVYHSHASLCVS